jgi:gamma-butyrobetaine dioxygenase
VQLLHCLVNAAEGSGATTFCDGFAVAEKLRAEDQDAFALLAGHRHPFEYRDPTQGVLLRAETPVIQLNPAGEVERVSFNNRSAVCISLPPKERHQYYAAWARFDQLANVEKHQVRLALRPGDLAVFSNARVMHGREAFVSGGKRHIQGCYIDHDAIYSCVAWSAAERGMYGASCDVHQAHTDATMQALATQSGFSYGEGIDMLQHALQAAHHAAQQDEPPNVVLAALMHDVGNSPQARDVWTAAGHEPARQLISPSDGSIGFSEHAELGALFLSSMGFAAEVTGAVQLHVSAKRALVSMDASYMDVLSQASIDTLAQQGGPMSDHELVEFQRVPGADIALRLRRYDDQGKGVGVDVPQLEAYRELIMGHLISRSAMF